MKNLEQKNLVSQFDEVKSNITLSKIEWITTVFYQLVSAAIVVFGVICLIFWSDAHQVYGHGIYIDPDSEEIKSIVNHELVEIADVIVLFLGLFFYLPLTLGYVLTWKSRKQTSNTIANCLYLLSGIIFIYLQFGGFGSWIMD